MRVHLFISAIVTVVAIALPTSWSSAAHAVTGIINGDGVDVGDQWTVPGDGGSPGSDGSPGGSWLGPYRPQVPWELAHAYCVALIVPPRWCADIAPGESTPAEPALPDLTLSDIAHVEPQSPTLTTQPTGWSVVGLETNLLAHIQTHTVATVVRNRDVDVRFTPVRYEWTYGDGATGATEVPGASWADLGVPEFAPTTTSHRYVNATAMTPQVDVIYSVDYRWPDHSWTPIAGALRRSAQAPIVFVQNADTVLVTGPCTSQRPAVGCR